jgi:hypothetical protein
MCLAPFWGTNPGAVAFHPDQHTGVIPGAGKVLVIAYL